MPIPMHSPDRALPIWSDCPHLRSIRSRFKGLVLLAGSPREGPLGRSIGRAILDLPVRPKISLLSIWLAHAAELTTALGIDLCSIRVFINQGGKSPAEVVAPPGVSLTVEFDREELRGTGGLLRDLSTDYSPGDLLLVCNANQLLLEPLVGLVQALASEPGQVRLLSSDDGVPLGLQLVDVGVLRGIKSKGFVDLKEQALPALALKSEIRVTHRADAAVLPVRTLDDYIHAVRLANAAEDAAVSDPFAEDWFESFRVIEDGAFVEPSARIHDSVVLYGAKVGAGVVLVRSLVCPGAVVAAGSVISDDIVPGDAARYQEMHP